MLTERKWDSIPPRAFALDGGADGSVFLASTKNFKVKQKVAISAIGLPSLSLEVKKVISPTQLVVGPFSSKMSDKTDLSLYTLLTNPTIRAEEQDRSGIPTEQHERAVYAEEPIIAKRVILVDEIGQYFNETNAIPVNVISGGGSSGGGLAPSNFDDVKIIRDFEEDPISYEFYLALALVGKIDVFYNLNKSSIEYKKIV